MSFLYNKFVCISLIILLQTSCSSSSLKTNTRNPAEVDFSQASLLLGKAKTLIKFRESNFYKELLRSQQIFSNPNIDNKTKSAQLDDFFTNLEISCHSNCDTIIKTIETANTDIGAKSLKILSKEIKLEQSHSFIKENLLKIDSKLLLEFKNKLQLFLKGKDQKFIASKITASLQLLRYVIALEEDLIFDLASKEKARESKTLSKKLNKSLNKYKKQFQALYSLYGIFKPNNDKIKLDLSNLPIETIQKIAKNINDLGLFYIKFAQSISNNKMIFNKEQQEIFKVFQDDLGPMKSSEVLDTIENEFNKPAHEIFINFNPDDYLATGSIAQVYKTKIKTSFGIKDVIVKVQRNGLEEVINDNKKLNHILLGTGKIFTPVQYAPVLDLIAGALMGIENAFEKELDFVDEAKNMQRFRNYFKFSSKIKVPKVYNNFSGSKVLTMEVIEGENIDKAWSKFDNNLRIHHSKKIFNNLLDSFLYQVLITKELHADMHPGNIILKGQNIGLIDMGQVFKSKGLITAPIKLWWNFMMGNTKGVEKSLLNLGSIDGELGMTPKKLKDFRDVIENVIKKSRYERVKIIKPILTGGTLDEFKKVQYNFSLAHLNNFGLLATELLTKGHFNPSPMYIQFFRSATPILSTIYSIGKNIPKDDLKKIFLRKLILTYPVGYLKYFSSYTLRAHKELPKIFDKFLKIKKPNCKKLLNLL